MSQLFITTPLTGAWQSTLAVLPTRLRWRSRPGPWRVSASPSLTSAQSWWSSVQGRWPQVPSDSQDGSWAVLQRSVYQRCSGCWSYGVWGVVTHQKLKSDPPVWECVCVYVCVGRGREGSDVCMCVCVGWGREGSGVCICVGEVLNKQSNCLSGHPWRSQWVARRGLRTRLKSHKQWMGNSKR